MLERFLRQAMAGDPGQRPRSALKFARVLQTIAQEQRLPITSLQIADEEDERLAPRPSSAPETRARPQMVAAQLPVQPPAQPPREPVREPVREPARGPAPEPIREVPGQAAQAAQARVSEPAQEQRPGAGAPDTVQKAPQVVEGAQRPVGRIPSGPRAAKTQERITPVDPEPKPKPSDDPERLAKQAQIRRRRLLMAAGLAAVVAAAVGGAVALTGGKKKPGVAPASAGSSEVASAPDDSGIAPLPGVPVVRAAATPGEAVFRWGGYDNVLPGDGFRWRRSGSGTVRTGTATAPVLRVALAAGGEACLAVQVVRGDGSAVSAFSDPACTTVPAAG